MQLRRALGIGPGTVVAVVGSGGKTSLILALVQELTHAGLRVVFTTTTKVFPPVMETVLLQHPLALSQMRGLLEAGIPCCVAQSYLPEGKLCGIHPDRVVTLAEAADVVLVEADGSRGLPVKFPADHEPVIPEIADLVVPVAGADCLNHPLGAATAHRYEAAAAFLGCAVGDPITPERLARLLWDPQATTRGRPAGARVVPVINKVDTPELEALAAQAAAELLVLGAPRVVLAAARDGIRSPKEIIPHVSVGLVASLPSEPADDDMNSDVQNGKAAFEEDAPAEAAAVPAEPAADAAAEAETDAAAEAAAEVEPDAAALAAPEPDLPPDPRGPGRAVMGPVAGLVLAGGASRRFGPGHKLLHRLAGRTILERSLAAPLSADLREVVVVTGAAHAEMQAILERLPVKVVVNPEYERGMSTSMRAGLNLLFPADPPRGYQPPAAVVIFLADQPGLSRKVVNRLVETWRETGAAIVIPTWKDRRRNPVLFGAELVPELLQVSGDEGGRRVVQAHSDRVVQVPFADGELFRDIDSPQDLPETVAKV